MQNNTRWLTSEETSQIATKIDYRIIISSIHPPNIHEFTARNDDEAFI